MTEPNTIFTAGKVIAAIASGRAHKSESVELPNDPSLEWQGQAKPSSQSSAEAAEPAASSQPSDDPNQADPNERTDMITERRDPGRHGGGGDPAWKKP